ncbi:MAG: 4Fe-4S dicluster domain-containing protein [Proteobacteria bacterium]|nr:4Fe-4S dicluster domain-containing protein [Pseudomonadota bacterium]
MEIIIGEGTCGIAAGSKEILATFEKLLPGGKIRTVGCIGMCHQEVMTEIVDKDGASYIYGNVTKKNIPKILDFHLNGGTLQSDLLIQTPEKKEGEAIEYVTKQTRIALRNVGFLNPRKIDEYQNRSGYLAISEILKSGRPPENVIKEVKAANIRGRGGAGFPSAVKWGFARGADSEVKYLICNGDEGDPGAFMDRSLLEGDPHNVVEGMLIAAYAIGATNGYAYIRAEYPLAVKNFALAIETAKEAGYLGKNILGSDFSFDIKIKQGAGAFVCGEETALIASIEGERGMPRLRPPFPAVKGLFGKPTIINNVETLANLPWIINEGGAEYSKIGTEACKGTKVFALAGAIKKGGLVEVPMGTTLRDVIFGIGDGSGTGRPIKAVQLGGPSGGTIPEHLFDTPIEYETINATGAIMGSGGMIVMDDKTCMVDLARYFLDFTQLESCGKCTFCRIGTLRMKELLGKICDGKATLDDLEILDELVEQIKKASLCGLGQGAPNPVATTLKYFREEYVAHIKERRCPAGVCKELISHTITSVDCTGCTLCEKSCPTDAITGTPKLAGSYIIDHATCINCGMCVEVCKPDCIVVE